MTIEERLKEYILQRYGSLKDFSSSIDMSNSTVNSILIRGIGNSTVSNIIKICKALGISADALADGKIVPVKEYKQLDPNQFEVKEILADVKSQLSSLDGLTLDGKPAEQNDLDTIIKAINIGEEMTKKV